MTVLTIKSVTYKRNKSLRDLALRDVQKRNENNFESCVNHSLQRFLLSKVLYLLRLMRTLVR